MPIEIKITMSETGQVGISGPIDNQLLCYGLLEMAKVVIANRAHQNENRVQPAPPGIVLPKL